MNNGQLNDILLGYPVTVCCVYVIKIQKGRFVISNSDISQGLGKNWVAFYFPKRRPYEFFDSLGNRQEEYGVGFEKKLRETYFKNFGQYNNLCLTCAYYSAPTTS